MVNYLLRRRDDLVAPEIPFDLMIEILSRLPAKSLMKFKCVSKLWSCLIRCRYFSNLYLMVSSSLSRPRPRPLGLYMSLNMSLDKVRHYRCDSMEKICQNPGKFELLSLRLTSSSSSSSAESWLEPDLSFPGMGGDRMVSLRGLILFTVCREACIYNPTTRQSLTLPTFKSNLFAQQEPNKHVHYFFGHDPVLDQYKIVCSVMIGSLQMLFSEFWVFVLEPGGFWKRIDQYDAQPHISIRQGLCINGVIYYLALNHTCRYQVYCFDVRSEDIRVIQAPPHAVPHFSSSFGFIEHGGKPAIFEYTRIRETGVSELWVLEVDGEIWSRKSLVLKPCQRHLVDEINIINLIVHGTSDQNNEVILTLASPCYLLYYDLIKNDLRKVNINRATTRDVCVKVLDKCESIMHLET
ncbi:hypothetical protein N665_0451s0031 [Sinapis alba]|nr:hypothetical protein N665_0451s0031 [Sinapis alba]